MKIIKSFKFTAQMLSIVYTTSLNAINDDPNFYLMDFVYCLMFIIFVEACYQLVSYTLQ